MEQLATQGVSWQESTPDSFFSLLGGVKPVSYCRWFWYRNDFSDDYEGQRHCYVPCGTTRRKRAGMESLDDFRSRVPGQINQYFTPNLFFDWRNKALLAGLCANYVEIDTTVGYSLRPDQCEQVRLEVFSQIQAAGIPLPSAFVESGSGGLHLYWTYDVVDAWPSRQTAWLKVAHALTAALHGGALWKVDTAASHDMTRFLRLPGSVHGSTVLDVRPFISTNATEYTFDDLTRLLSVSSDHQRSFHLTANEPVFEPSTRTASNGLHNISAWWLRVYWHIHRFVLDTGNIAHGQRDKVAFIMFVALRRTTSLTKAWERIKDINRMHIGLTEQELEQYLSTASRVHYRYKKETLASYLAQAGIPVPVFLAGGSIQWKKSLGLEKDEIRRRQSVAAAKTASKRRKRTLTSIIAAIQQGIPVTHKRDIAKVANLSLRTVQRLIHVAVASITGSVYPPPCRDGEVE